MSNIARRTPWLLSFLLALGACKTASTAAPPAAATPVVPAAAAAPAQAPEPLAPAAGELVLRAPDVAGDSVAMTLVVAALPKVLADLDALSTRLGLPMPLGQSIVPALTGSSGPGGVVLTAEMLQRLDSAQPTSVVWLTPNASAPAGWCAAITFKDANLARQTLGQLGRILSHSGAASQLRTPSGATAWAGLKDRTLLVANSEAVLLSGGPWAQAQQQAPLPGQLVFTIRPQVMAKPSGKPIDALLAGALDQLSTEIEAASPAGKNITVASRNTMKAAMKVLARPVADLATLRLIANVHADRGVTVRAELEPVGKSPFATRVAKTSPMLLDPGLPVRGESVAVLAAGDWSSSAQDWADVLAASGPAGQAAAKAFLALKQSVARMSCSVDLSTVPLSSLCSSEVRPGVSPKKALDDYLAFNQASEAWAAELEGRRPVAIKVNRSGQQVDLETHVDSHDANARALMKGLFGGEVIKSTVAVKKGHLVHALGRTPHDVLASYGKPAKGTGSVVSGALSEAQGADVTGVVDVASLALRFIGASEDSSTRQAAAAAALIPGLADLRVPIAVSLRGGSMLSVELRAPLGSLENVAKVVRGFMGTMGAQ
jgi:hypothetical protein